MTWDTDGEELQASVKGALVPIEVLYELDTPKIFTAKLMGELALVYESAIDFEQRTIRLIATPTSSRVLDALKDGSKTIMQALDQPWVWAIVQGFDGTIQKVVALERGMNSVPEGYKPKKSAMLWPHLTPLVTVRLIGAGLTEGHIPASVIKRAAEGIPSALKKMFEEATGTPKQGRPDDDSRTLYDLEAQRLAFASFEIAFRPARQSTLALTSESADPYSEQGMILRSALKWAIDADPLARTPSFNVIEALDKLIPPMHGIVERVELTGRLLEQSEPFVLTRSTSKKVKTQLTAYRALSSPRTLRTVEGIIDALDKGMFTLILRGTVDGESLTFGFPEDYLDDIFIAFTHGIRVRISGRGQQNKQVWEMVGLEPLEPLPALPSADLTINNPPRLP